MDGKTERPAAYLRMMEKVPTGAYMAAALGAIAGSATLRLLGKKDATVFVGQWPPTFILFALAYKLLRPSREHPTEELRAGGGRSGARGNQVARGDLLRRAASVHSRRNSAQQTRRGDRDYLRMVGHEVALAAVTIERSDSSPQRDFS